MNIKQIAAVEAKLDTMTGAELVAAYNEAATFAGIKTVNRFADRSKAVHRLTGLLLSIAGKLEHEAAENGRNGTRPATQTELTLDAAAVQAAPQPEKPADAPKPARAPRTTGRVILKGNKAIRAALKEAAGKLGGTRLLAIGFKDYSEFLNGFDLTKDRTTTLIRFEAIKGKGKLPGSVVLTIEHSNMAMEVIASRLVDNQ